MQCEHEEDKIVQEERSSLLNGVVAVPDSYTEERAARLELYWDDIEIKLLQKFWTHIR